MAAHPLTIQPIESQGSYNVNPGTILCTKFDLGTVSRLTITMIKTAPTQDFSLRCWVSNEPGGVNIVKQNSLPSNWHPGSAVTSAWCFYTGTFSNTENPILTNNVMVDPGVYYLNVLNLINSPNTYTGTFIIENQSIPA